MINPSCDTFQPWLEHVGSSVLRALSADLPWDFKAPDASEFTRFDSMRRLLRQSATEEL